MNGSDFRKFIIQDAAVAALLGSEFHIDRGLDLASDPHVIAMIVAQYGDITHQSTLATTYWQIKVRSKDIATAKSVADAIYDRCERHNGSFGDYNFFSRVTFQRSDFEEKTRYFVRQLDVEVRYAKKEW